MTGERFERQLRRAAENRDSESYGQAELLRSRQDQVEEFDYFLNLLQEGPQRVSARTKRPVVATMCLSAPLELFEAHGLQPLRLTGGHQPTERLAAPNLPSVMCPMLRSALGAALLAQHGAGDGSSHFYAGQVIPTTCDWVTRFGDLAALAGVEINSIHRLANPKVKNSHLCLKAWENEIRGLIRFLSQLSGKKISRRELKKSVGRYREAYAAFSDLIDHKRAGRIDQIWFSVVAGSFNFDLVERWSENVHKLNTKLAQKEPATAGGQVFLAGSPIIFPNFKILSLIQEAGLAVVMDDLCSSERILPGPVHLGDDSLEGLTEALSQRYYLGCLCPTFADDDRRINNILSPAHKVMFRGVIFHVLKGCHPFDLESLVLENQIKEAGLKFIRLETDYAKEDTASLLTRLEAYAGTL